MADYNVFILLTVVVICSYAAVKSWIDARRLEREAFYRTEAVKKVVDLQGNVSESLLETLRSAIEQQHKPPTWHHYDYNREREAYYRSETLKRIASQPGGAEAVVEFLRNEDNRAARQRGETSKLAGMIIGAAGLGMMVFLRLLDDARPVYMMGLIPFLIGAALLVYAFAIMPRIKPTND
jgi:phage gpG-like protein